MYGWRWKSWKRSRWGKGWLIPQKGTMHALIWFGIKSFMTHSLPFNLRLPLDIINQQFELHSSSINIQHWGMNHSLVLSFSFFSLYCFYRFSFCLIAWAHNNVQMIIIPSFYVLIFRWIIQKIFISLEEKLYLFTNELEKYSIHNIMNKSRNLSKEELVSD